MDEVGGPAPGTGVPDAESTDVAVFTFSLRRMLTRAEPGRPAPVWAAPLGVYALTRLILYLATVYASRATLIGGGSALLSGWDAGHYLSIVESGYPSHVNSSLYSTVAFFPGFPVVVKSLTLVLRITPLEAGMTVAIVAGALFVLVATRLVALVYGDVAARRAGMLLAAFPGAYVFFVPYAECLACLFVACAFLATRRGRPYRAGVWGALATFTSPVTAPLVPALLFAAWRRRDAKMAVGAGLATLGFLAYMAFLGQHTGDLFTWFHDETLGYNAHFSLSAPFDHLRIWPAVGGFFLASLVVFALGAYAMWAVEVPTEWAVYAVLLTAATVFDTALWVNPRVLMNAFPLILALGVWLKRDWYRMALTLAAALTPVVFLLYFTIGSVTGPP